MRLLGREITIDEAADMISDRGYEVEKGKIKNVLFFKFRRMMILQEDGVPRCSIWKLLGGEYRKLRTFPNMEKLMETLLSRSRTFGNLAVGKK